MTSFCLTFSRTTGTITYPMLLSLCLRMTLPTAWISEVLVRFLVPDFLLKKQIASSAGISTPSLKQRTLVNTLKIWSSPWLSSLNHSILLLRSSPLVLPSICLAMILGSFSSHTVSNAFDWSIRGWKAMIVLKRGFKEW